MTKTEGIVRPAVMQDVDAIHHLISYYAERNQMLFRVLEDLFERLREFRVFADAAGKVLGCCGLALMWRDLAEIRSLAVDPNYIGCGIGKKLVLDAVNEARTLGLKQVFALTYESSFFEKLGFVVVEKEKLPHKVWTDCIHCEMQNNCQEIPLVLDLT
ncbi:MAG: N-acetyltransferase [Phycisphaerae bacterium]